jgi:hypothetical protein
MNMMLMKITLALLGRLLVVTGLIALSFGTPSMASGNPADCMAMMQDSGQMSKTMSDMGKQCPFAAVCAIAGLYVTPAPPTSYAMAAMSDAGLLSFGETNGVGLVSSPPSRPPRF